MPPPLDRATGPAAYTDQYWCPIKHARRIRNAHGHYPKFFEYGNAEAFRRGIDRLRGQYAKEKPPR